MTYLKKNNYSEVLAMEVKDDLIDDIDYIEISLVERVRDIVSKQPDVREEKIKKIKEKYSNPDYEPDAADVADGIIDELKILGEIKKNL